MGPYLRPTEERKAQAEPSPEKSEPEEKVEEAAPAKKAAPRTRRPPAKE